jgi:thioredoxin 1
MSNKIIKFGAEWCGPCKAMKPQMEKFKELILESDVEVLDIDVDAEENADLARQYGVRSIPYTVFLKDDKVERAVTGLKTSNELYQAFQEIYQN